jgi:hypothetical protein
MSWKGTWRRHWMGRFEAKVATPLGVDVSEAWDYVKVTPMWEAVSRTSSKEAGVAGLSSTR